MRRLIDANSLKHSMDKYNYSYFGTNYDKILEVVDEEPTIDPVKHAHWIPDAHDLYAYYCSNCGEDIDYMGNHPENTYRYCFGCGCKMDEVTE